MSMEDYRNYISCLHDCDIELSLELTLNEILNGVDQYINKHKKCVNCEWDTKIIAARYMEVRGL